MNEGTPTALLAAPGTPFSIARYWAQGDAISHAVAYLLLAMSLVSWFLILSKAYSLYRVRRAAPALDAFWAAPSLRDGIAILTLADGENVFAPLPASALARLRRTSSKHSSRNRHGFMHGSKRSEATGELNNT